MHVYDVKFKDTFEKMEVLSKIGLSIKIDLSFRYQPVSDQIGYLHDEVGKDYLEKIIKPEIRYVTNILDPKRTIKIKPAIPITNALGNP